MSPPAAHNAAAPASVPAVTPTAVRTAIAERGPTHTGGGGRGEGRELLPSDAERAFAAGVIEAEAGAVSSLVGRLDDAFWRSVELLTGCADSGGTILVSGLGKSGLVGAKISATLASLGAASHFVHPAEAAHGDLGRFRPRDVCLALSYSGETEELVRLAAMLAHERIPVVSMTRGAGGSQLERLSAERLSIGDVEDPARLASPAPACSTTAMLALGDALALCVSRRRGFTDADFAKRHPGGTLGRLYRPVMEIVRFVAPASLVPVPDGVSVVEAMTRAETAQRRPGAVVLVDAGTGVLTGIFTDADLRRLVERDRAALDRPVREVMTRSPGTLPSTALVVEAVEMVRAHRRDEVPIVDGAGRPVALLDIQDLVAAGASVRD